MCGIAGLWDPSQSPAERARLVNAMLASLAHRGPDGMAVWGDDEITLGLARLAIVDPTSPARVLGGASGRVHAVVNGEIYNYRELVDLSGVSADADAARLDTAVVVPLYQRFGADFAQRLDGMYAIALWDAGARRLLLVRDRAGEKPLFTVAHGGRVAFASEPRALLRLPWVARDPAPAALLRYLVHGFVAAPDAAFEGMRQVAPASVVEFDGRGERVRAYWRPWDGIGRPIPATDAARVARTRDELEHAVALRVPAEQPFGVFLSGGLDSSLIAAVAARIAPRFPTFSLALAGHGYDESAYAREVARHVGSDHHNIAMDDVAGREALDALADTMDHPLGDPSVIPTWYLARFASRHVPVVLTGEGGDELFAGYPTYLGHRLAAQAERLPGGLAAMLLATARRLRPRDRHLSLAHLVERLLEARGLAPFDRHLTWFGNFPMRDARALLHPDLAARADDGAARAHLGALEHELVEAGLGAVAGEPPLAGYQLLDFVLALGSGLLTKVDRSTMAHSVESRAPFLRAELIEWALALPEHTKLRGITGKWVLKEVAKPLLPARVITRRKQGFSPPFSAWARGPWKSHVCEVLAPARIERAGVLDGARVDAVLQRHLRGEVEAGRALWSLLSLQLWAERWLVSERTVPLTTEAAPATVAHG